MTNKSGTVKTAVSRRDHLWSQARSFALLGGIFLGAGCASMTKHDWLNLFFDGVPGGSSAAPAGKPIQGVDNDGYPVVLRATAPTPPESRKINLHPPFGDNDCTACHESKFSQQIKQKPPGLCFSCHDDFLAKAKVKHSPAEEGECLSCHNPHQSEEKFLLLRKGKALCAECHDDMTPGKFKHAPADEGECIACHNPHQSDQKALIRRAGKALCAECHDDMTKGKVKHAPAEEGACLDCHKPHSSDVPFLLRKQGAALCYDCHDQGDTAKQAEHIQAGGKVCTDCHNPHSSDYKALQKTAPADKSSGSKVVPQK